MTAQVAPEKVETPSREPLRLNLGGRGTKIKGFKTVDLSPEHDVDFRSDVSDLSAFKDKTVDQIYASHILEHFPHVKTLSVLKEWYRVLRVDGKLFVSVPDFDRAVDLYKKYGLSNYLTNLLYGDQGYDLAFHYAPFTAARLSFLLNQAGFADSKRILWMPYEMKDCSARVDTLEGKPISLSMEATK